MTREMHKNNTGRAESPGTASPHTASPAANNLASASFSPEARNEVARQVAVDQTVNSGTVLFEGSGILNTHTPPEVLSPTPGGASVPVTLIYGKNGSITFKNGPLDIPESGIDAGEYAAALSGLMNYNGDLSNGDNDRAADAGNPVEFTPTIRFVAA
ncbi:MAG: hypothetical protein ACO3XO_07815 [Bdellovibrionota bacterium]